MLSFSNSAITLTHTENTPVSSAFMFLKKNARISGQEQRGYFMEVKITSSKTDPYELFSVSTNASDSYIK